MANTKNKVTRQNVTKKRTSNTKESSTGSKEESLPKDTQYIVMRRPSNRKVVPNDVKVQYCLQNGQNLVKKLKLKTKKCTPPNSTKKIPPDLKGYKPPRLLLTKKEEKNQLPTKNSGIEKRVSKILPNDILESDLLVVKPRKKRAIHVNNNDMLITDQNTNNVDNAEQVISRDIEIIQINDGGYQLSNPKIKFKYVCDYCRKTFTKKFSLQRHISAHVGRKSYPCSNENCKRKFSTNENMEIHVQRYHVLKEDACQYICEICDKPFLTKKDLVLHLSSHAETVNPFKCVYCDESFSYHPLLVQHEKQHLVNGRYQCSLCNKSYSCRRHLYSHIKSHLNIRDYICQYCGKEFLRDNSMKRHVEVCHGGQRIQCPICKKHLKGHLTEHMRTHENIRPHKCCECGMSFTQSTQLNVHRRSHTGDRPYECRICNRLFTLSNALMLHVRRHTGERPFACTMCPLTFSQLPHMKNHLRTIHGETYPYKCTRCKLSFKKRIEFDGHAKVCTAKGEGAGDEEIVVESPMTLSRMRFLLALLLTMIATEARLKYLGFNKRLIDHILNDALEGMGRAPCKDEALSPVIRLRTNIQLLLNVTVPQKQMAKFVFDQKSTEEILELLTTEKQ